MYCEAHTCAAVKDGKVRRKPRQISRGVRVPRLDCRRLIKFRPAERLPRALRSEASARIWKIRRRERREGLGMAASWMARSAIAFAAYATLKVLARSLDLGRASRSAEMEYRTRSDAAVA